MNNNYNDKDIPDYEDLDDEILRIEVNRIIIKHSHDYILRLEELGFVYHDDEDDQDRNGYATPSACDCFIHGNDVARNSAVRPVTLKIKELFFLVSYCLLQVKNKRLVCRPEPAVTDAGVDKGDVVSPAHSVILVDVAKQMIFWADV